jgi:hypothetical protein
VSWSGCRTLGRRKTKSSVEIKSLISGCLFSLPLSGITAQKAAFEIFTVSQIKMGSFTAEEESISSGYRTLCRICGGVPYGLEQSPANFSKKGHGDGDLAKCFQRFADAVGKTFEECLRCNLGKSESGK